MDTIKVSEPVIGGTLGGLGYGGGYNNNNGIDSLLALALLGGNGFGRNRGDGRTVEELELGNLRKEVADNKSAIRETIFEQTNEQTNQFNHVNGKLFEIEKEALRQQIETLKTNNELNNKIDNKFEATERSIFGLKVDMDKEFCGLRSTVERGFEGIRVEGMREEIAGLKDQLAASNTANQTTTIVSTILSAMGISLPLTAKKSA